MEFGNNATSARFIPELFIMGSRSLVSIMAVLVRFVKKLFNFGGYLLAANILQVICQNLQGIIIGRKFSATQMGYYSQAKNLMM